MAKISGDDVLEDVAIQLQTGLVEEGTERRVATEIAIRVTQKMRDLLGGQNVYFPRGLRHLKSARDAAIHAAFDGTNYQALAIEHGVSEIRIRQIISAQNLLRRSARQSH